MATKLKKFAEDTNKLLRGTGVLAKQWQNREKAVALLRRAKEKLAKQDVVVADELCHMFRDALETRTVIPRGARVPNGAGTPRRYYRESCADPGSTPLKRLRCQKLCCRSYDQHIRPKGTRPGDRDHCEGIKCKIPRRPVGAKGKTLERVGSSGPQRPRSGDGTRNARAPPSSRPSAAAAAASGPAETSRPSAPGSGQTRGASPAISKRARPASATGVGDQNKSPQPNKRPRSAGTAASGSRPRSAATARSGSRPRSAGTAASGSRPRSAGTAASGSRSRSAVAARSAGTAASGSRSGSAVADASASAARPFGSPLSSTNGSRSVTARSSSSGSDIPYQPPVPKTLKRGERGNVPPKTRIIYTNRAR
jgi:hypothetical protein